MATRSMVKEKREGCYSVLYTIPSDHGSIYAMDYGWPYKNSWGCSETPIGPPSWYAFRQIPQYGYDAFLEHFGLAEDDMPMNTIITMNPSPADLARLRRAKEKRYGMPHLEMKNQRMGCPKDEMADDFEAQP